MHLDITKWLILKLWKGIRGPCGVPGAVRGAPRGAGHIPALRAPAGLLRDAGLRPAAANVPRPVRAARLRGRRRIRLDRQDHGKVLPLLSLDLPFPPLRARLCGSVFIFGKPSLPGLTAPSLTLRTLTSALVRILLIRTCNQLKLASFILKHRPRFVSDCLSLKDIPTNVF